jgi:hypothetical protein
MRTWIVTRTRISKERATGIEGAVENGADLIIKVAGVNALQQINVETLNMGSGSDGVIERVFGTLEDGYDKLGMGGSNRTRRVRKRVEHGFATKGCSYDYNALTRVWKAEIKKRREHESRR